ncbi:MAG: hypothetical protein JEY99_11115 [Spirochaetales bacterium]|nr:hypothetical protein [Spirochaetales bacterium]
MENMRKELDVLKAKFKVIEDDRKIFFKDFADFLLDDPQKEAVSALPELEDGINRLASINGEKDLLKNKVKEINDLLDEKVRIEDARKNTRDVVRELEKANMSLYENMGRSGYQAYQDGLLKGEGFASVFLTLEEEKEKINTFEVELKRSGEGEANFFKKIMNRSREVYLKSNQSMRIRNLVKIYQKAGETIGEMDPVPWEENDSLKHAFLPFYKNREKQDELTKRDTELSLDEQKVRDKMEVLGVQRNSGKKIQELIDGMDFQDDKLDQEKFYLGQSWWGLDKKKQKEFSIPAELKKVKDSLDKADSELKEAQEILEKKIRVDELTERLKMQDKDRQKLENKLNQIKDDLNRKNSEIEETKKELESLKDELS